MSATLCVPPAFSRGRMGLRTPAATWDQFRTCRCSRATFQARAAFLAQCFTPQLWYAFASLLLQLKTVSCLLLVQGPGWREEKLGQSTPYSTTLNLGGTTAQAPAVAPLQLSHEVPRVPPFYASAHAAAQQPVAHVRTTTQTPHYDVVLGANGQFSLRLQESATLASPAGPPAQYHGWVTAMPPAEPPPLDKLSPSAAHPSPASTQAPFPHVPTLSMPPGGLSHKHHAPKRSAGPAEDVGAAALTDLKRSRMGSFGASPHAASESDGGVQQAAMHAFYAVPSVDMGSGRAPSHQTAMLQFHHLSTPPAPRVGSSGPVYNPNHFSHPSSQPVSSPVLTYHQSSV